MRKRRRNAEPGLVTNIGERDYKKARSCPDIRPHHGTVFEVMGTEDGESIKVTIGKTLQVRLKGPVLD